MLLLKFLHVFIIPMPSVDKLHPDQAVIQIIIAKNIGAEPCEYGKVARHLIIQGKTEVPDIEIFAHFDEADPESLKNWV